MTDLLGYDAGREAGDIGMAMTAAFSRCGRARLSLVYSWDETKPAAAWLMNNPSIAGRDGGGEPTFDPTARRVIHFSRMMGCGSARLVNWCPLVATDPADLWRMLKAGLYQTGMQHQNDEAIARNAFGAPFLFLATGEEGLKRHPRLFRHAVAVFSAGFIPLCLGTTDRGAPLHPLARGKHAIPNDRRPQAFDKSRWQLWTGRLWEGTR